MRTLTGIAASPGAALAPAFLFRPDVYDVPDVPDAEPASGVVQLGRALEQVAVLLDERAAGTAGAPSEILHAQAALARDPALRQAAEAAIRAGSHPARAVVAAGEQFARTLERSGNSYLAARAPDIRHICDLAARAVVAAPARQRPLPDRPSVLVADDLMPADTAGLDPGMVRGIVTARGGRTSHTSVIARSLGIPAVVGVSEATEVIADGQTLGLDGCTGEVVIEPDAVALRRIAGTAYAYRRHRARLRAAVVGGPARTTDGARVEVAANVSGPEELAAALREGADGVGLLRTELLYLDRPGPPTGPEQVEVFRRMRELLGGRRLVIRTFDIGTDKQVPFLPTRPEPNPELGVRGLRLARLHPELLEVQLRAIAAAARSGPTAVMAPMVSTVEEARWFAGQVAAAGMPAGTEVGVMVEVPALALMADQLAPYVDFMSIGTNDLMQYLFAADRRDDRLGRLPDPFSPAVLRAVASVCRGAGDSAWVGVCGEAASEPAWALLAIGLGVRELSMNASAVAGVKAAITGASLAACQDAAHRALCAADAAGARSIAEILLKEQS
jgi:phosphotransferase system enzyme I (PtsI)